MVPMRPLVKALLVFLLATAGCSNSESRSGDAGSDRPAAEVALPPSDAPVPLTVDFTVQNCPSFDSVALTCTGVVPLTLQFVPLVTAAVGTYIWDFGDGPKTAFQAAPSHTYLSPGSYDVKLLVRGTDQATKEHLGFVVATGNPIGAPCDSDVQCDDGAICICPTGSACSLGLSRGICAKPCQTGACGDGQVCAGLRTASPPPGQTAAWQTSLCLRACSRDSDCDNGLTGLRCRMLPPGLTGGAWVQGCFGNLPVEVGDPCSDATGALRDDLCVAGACVAMGVRGLCSMSCDTASCAPESGCAVFGDGRKLCLRPCTGGFACLADPLLTCVVPGTGDLGYQLADPFGANSASSYCAPEPCSIADPTDHCLPAGVCGGDHCVQRGY
jgi:PKD domain